MSTPIDPKAKRMLELAHELPYAPVENPDWADKAALGIAHNLTTRTGIRDNFNQMQPLVRQDLVKTFAAVIRAAAALEQAPVLAVEPTHSAFLPTPNAAVVPLEKGPAGEPGEPVYIWTIQMGKWRAARDAGIDLLDITAKSGVSAFAPEMQNVLAYKRGEISDEDYTVLYVNRMQRTKEEQPAQWERLKEMKRVALACYCRKDHFCHRHIFANLMQDYLAENGIPSQLQGELTPD